MRKFWKLFAFLSVFLFGCSEDSPIVLPDCPQCPEDTTPPVRITDLFASSITDSTVELSWTAPGDDQAQGRASFYDIRYTPNEDDLAQWSDDCFLGPEKTPAMSGEMEMITITGLDLLERNFFGLKTADEDSNWSTLSNVLIVETLCTLAVTSPGGGDYFCEGDTMDIAWTTHECQSETVDIFLLLDGQICQTIGEDVENTGERRWVADQYWDNVSNYKIAISQHDGPDFPTSEGYFSITSGCGVEMVFPNGGEYLCYDSYAQIIWNQSSCCDGPFLVELLHNYSVIDTLESINYSGSSWHLDSSLQDQNGYQIRVTNIESGASDVSEYSFQVGGSVPPVVQFPTGGEIFQENQNIGIAWEPYECSGGWVRIELEHNGEICYTISESTANDRFYSWASLSEGETEDGYHIVITDLTTGFSARSETPFTIERTCILQYLTPTFHSRFCAGGPLEVTWNSERWCGETVDLSLIQNYHNTSLATDVPNTGMWQGDIPTSTATGWNRIRIKDVVSSDSVDGPSVLISRAAFLDLNFPLGGEIFSEGQAVIIRWYAGTCSGQNLQINLLLDGDHCRTIASAVDITDNFFEWIAEACDDESGDYQIEIIESGMGITQRSNPGFQIINTCAIWMDQPAGGESYYSGEIIPVRWETSMACAEEVIVELVDLDLNVLFGPVSTANDGEYDFLPANMPEGCFFSRVRITDAVTSDFALSGVFELRSSPFMVKADGSGHFDNIGEAVAAVRQGYQIILADGVYSGPGNTNVIMGNVGFSIESESGNPENCVIDCNGSGFGFNLEDIDHRISFSGMKIMNGVGAYTNDYWAGGVTLHQSDAVFTNCIFEENVLTGGQPGYAGAVASSYSSAEFINCLFIGNSDNAAGAHIGGAIYCWGYDEPRKGSLILQNCTFTDNGNRVGAIIELNGFMDCTIEQTIVSFNDGPAIVSATNSMVIECSDIFGNAESGWPALLAEWEFGYNNFSANPVFCDFPQRNLNIDSSSPCAPANSPCGLIVGSSEVGCR